MSFYQVKTTVDLVKFSVMLMMWGGEGEKSVMTQKKSWCFMCEFLWVPLSPSESRVIIFLPGRDKKEGRVAAVSNDI